MSDFSQIKRFLGIEQLPSVYLVAVKNKKFFKIGRAKGVLEYRISSLQCGCPYELKLLGSTRTPIPNEIERYLHKVFSDKRHRGEWFKLAEDEAANILEFFQRTNQHVESMFYGVIGGRK